MKSAVKMDVDSINNVDEQLWWASMGNEVENCSLVVSTEKSAAWLTLTRLHFSQSTSTELYEHLFKVFMPKSTLKNQNFEKKFIILGFKMRYLVMKSAVDIYHCSFLSRLQPAFFITPFS